MPLNCVSIIILTCHTEFDQSIEITYSYIFAELFSCLLRRWMEVNPISGAEAGIYLRGKGALFMNKESKVSCRPRSGTQPDGAMEQSPH